jgi:ABC-2 type transport system permease protein
MEVDVKHLRLILAYCRHNLMSAMAYRSAFLIQVLGMMLNNMMLLFFWTILFNRFPNLQGWDMRGIVLLYAIIAVGFGFANALCGNSGRVAQIIADGDLDYYLALPADPLIHLLVSRTSVPSWGDVAFGLIMFLIALPDRWAKAPLFLLVCILSGLIFIAFSVITGSLAFWIGQSHDLALQLRNMLLTFGLYPVDIFPGLIRFLLYTLIPAAFVGSIPAKLLTEFSLRNLGAMGAMTAVIVIVARLVFQWGLRRYESGNRVTARI